MPIDVAQLRADIKAAEAAVETLEAHVGSGNDYTRPNPGLVLSQRETVRRAQESVRALLEQLDAQRGSLS